MFKNEVIDIYMNGIMQNLKNAQVCIYSLADCVEFTFNEGRLGEFFMVKV